MGYRIVVEDPSTNEAEDTSMVICDIDQGTYHKKPNCCDDGATMPLFYIALLTMQHFHRVYVILKVL